MNKLVTKIIYLVIFNTFFLVLFTLGQTKTITVEGVVIDTAKIPVDNAKILLLNNLDTVTTYTNVKGEFTLKAPKGAANKLQVSRSGYMPVYLMPELKLKESATKIVLKPIILSRLTTLLKEVQIKEKKLSITLKKDTIEYNADAYPVHNNDMVDEILKQLPGVVIDNDGNVTADGKPMIKLRVNGKDFFTDNVKDFITQLPAGIISKLQIIDDYGDEAEFTGIKTGEPKKMLNLVTKPGMNRGSFGNILASAGTDARYGLSVNANYWLDTKQVSANGAYNTSNNVAGISNTDRLSANYRDNIKKYFTFNLSYDEMITKSVLSSQNFTQTITGLGTINSDNTNLADVHSNTKNILLGGDYKPDKTNYFTFSSNINFSYSENSNQTDARQSGVIFQNIKGNSQSMRSSPNINLNIVYARRFKKAGRSASVNLSYAYNGTNNFQNTANQINYLNSSAVNVKDSVLNLLINTRNVINTVSANINYSEPLNKNINLDMVYNFNYNHNNNALYTNNINTAGQLSKVDSLSNQFIYLFTTNRLNIFLKYKTEKLTLSVGTVLEHDNSDGDYADQSYDIKKGTLGFSPAANINYLPSKSNSFTFSYNGNSSPPSYYQLQPIRDTKDLQNIVVGNPDLKPAFSNSLSFNYRHLSKNGDLLSITAGGTVISNEIAINSILLNDILGGLKQETHYQNADGSYRWNALYNFSSSLINTGKRKLTWNISGSINYNNDVFFSNGDKLYNNAVSINQSLNIMFSTKTNSINTGLNYNNSLNNYKNYLGGTPKVEKFQLNISDKFYLTEDLIINISANKTINEGYEASLSTNPLIINPSVEQKLFKKKLSSLQIQAFDILDQGNTLTRYFSSNMIIETRNNAITRYFVVKFTMRISKFGK